MSSAVDPVRESADTDSRLRVQTRHAATPPPNVAPLSPAAPTNIDSLPNERAPLPNVAEVRQVMPLATRRRNLWLAARAIVPSALIYVGLIALIIVTPWWSWPPLVFAASIAAALLFIIAHDAAHDALTPYFRLNAWLARLCFLPAWHPYTGWVHAHNHVHHGWTNYQPKDYVWSPLSLAEYRAQGRARRWLTRVYRRWPGFGLYYSYEVLWKKIVLPQPESRKFKTRLIWLLDDLFVVAGQVVLGVTTVSFARSIGATTPAWLLIVGAQLVPALMAHWWIGFITYLQHTHPLIPWFQKLDEWSFYMGQVRGTTHTRFPNRINAWIHNVMEHTAHHVDPRIPLYYLPEAQDCLDLAHEPTQHKFTVRTFRYVQRVCQLYDFDRHCWLDYLGQPTSSQAVSDALLARARASRRRKAKAEERKSAWPREPHSLPTAATEFVAADGEAVP